MTQFFLLLVMWSLRSTDNEVYWGQSISYTSQPQRLKLRSQGWCRRCKRVTTVSDLGHWVLSSSRICTYRIILSEENSFMIRRVTYPYRQFDSRCISKSRRSARPNLSCNESCHAWNELSNLCANLRSIFISVLAFMRARIVVYSLLSHVALTTGFIFDNCARRYIREKLVRHRTAASMGVDYVGQKRLDYMRMLLLWRFCESEAGGDWLVDFRAI